jgi:hypothetical protein
VQRLPVLYTTSRRSSAKSFNIYWCGKELLRGLCSEALLLGDGSTANVVLLCGCKRDSAREAGNRQDEWSRAKTYEGEVSLRKRRDLQGNWSVAREGRTQVSRGRACDANYRTHDWQDGASSSRGRRGIRESDFSHVCEGAMRSSSCREGFSDHSRFSVLLAS